MSRPSRLDLYRYTGNSSLASSIKTWIKEPGYRYMYFFRMAQAYARTPLIGLVAKLLLRRCSHRFGMQIPAETKIGAGFYIGHFGTIVINKLAVIGKNCNISPGATIGQANRGKFAGTPTLGDSVWIGVNAIIVGKITIGDDVLIAPGAYVNVDVPSHSIVMGNPAVIKPREDATAGYIDNKV